MEHRSARATARWGIPLLLAVTGGCSAPPTGSEATASATLDDTVESSQTAEPSKTAEPSRAHASEADHASLRYRGWGHSPCPGCTGEAADGGADDAAADDAAAPACSTDEVTCGAGCCGPTNQMQCVSGACQPICDHAQPVCGGVCCPQGQLCNAAGVCAASP